MRLFSKLTLFKPALVILTLLCGAPLCLWAQPASIPFHKEPYFLSSGLHEGTAQSTEMKFRQTVRVPDAAWLQLHFSDYNLGTQSYLEIASLKDGGRQRLNSKSLPQWRKRTARFNGEAVEVELHVSPGDKNIFLRMDEIIVGERVGGGLAIETLCGDDDRVASTDPRVGRIILNSGNKGTGWIVSTGALLTAGHVVAEDMTILEFNVPPSLCDGTAQCADPNDQYSIDASSIVFANGGEGNDWAVFNCFPNSTTGLLPVQAQEAFFRMSRDHSPDDVDEVVVTGYGLDSSPPGCGSTFNANSQTEQTSSGPYREEMIFGPSIVVILHRVDTEPHNSGSPIIILNTTMTIGIHTGAGCTSAGGGVNRGTGFENDALENAIHTFPGANAVYVDRDHPVSFEEGTPFRPYSTVNQGVVGVPEGGIVSIVTGSYNEPMMIDKAMTLIAPVGPVTIGASSFSVIEVPKQGHDVNRRGSNYK